MTSPSKQANAHDPPPTRRRPSVRLAPPLLCVAMLGCADKPAPREAYSREPARAAIVPDCGPDLLDTQQRACVQIDVLAEGTGAEPAHGEWLRVHYIVLLPDGTEVDSSHDRKPLAVKLGASTDVIEGMHLGLAGMRVGELRRFVIPPKLGYRGQKLPGIPPDANLTFLVERMPD